MGLAKTAEAISIQPTGRTDTSPISERAGIPEQFYYHVGIDYNQMRDLTEKDATRLQEIYNWAYSDIDDKTLGNALKKVSDLDVHLGTPHGGQTKLAQLWQYVHLSNKINDIQKQRESLKRW